ncbi:MAG TPA: fibronectin type III domain-containing protein [Gaiellaceae bacterium]|nr:fibronectin type III domain-containing protein [Gaiellaceae bacterium]
MRAAVPALLLVLLALVAPGAAFAASPPSATTGPVESVGPTSATVTGTVDPNGTATSWYVQYGTSTSYGSKTADANAGSGTSGVPVSASLSGLKAGTTYHYRVVAKSSAGTTTGADGILTTASAPTAATGSASSVGASSAKLAASVDPNGRPTTWYFEYGTSKRYGTKTPVQSAGAGSTAVAVSASVTGLAAGRRYHFRIVATNDAGTAHGADHTFFTSAAPAATTKAPAAGGDTGEKLSGSAVPNGAATSAYFEYGTTASYGSRTAAKSLGSGSRSVNVADTLTGLAPATTYHVRFVATSSSGTGRGADRTFTTTGPPRASTSAPSAIGGLTATLGGTLNPFGHATTWYAEWGASTSYGNRTPVKSAGAGMSTVSIAAPVSGLVPGTLYHFRIVATNSSGTRASGDFAFTTLGPAVTLAASSTEVVASSAVRLTGTVITHDADRNVSIYARRHGQASFALVATVLTGSGGSWGYIAHPKIGTAYKATFAGGASQVAQIAVRPAVSLRSVGRGRFAVRVGPAGAYARRYAVLQRRTSFGGWRMIGRRRLGRSATATFTPKLARGRWTLRVSIAAAPGYAAATSRTLAYRKR